MINGQGMYVANDHGHVPFAVITISLFYHS